MTDYSAVLARFSGLTKCERCWKARCPAHEDCNPSLMIWVGRRGNLLARCMADKGCTWQAIVRESGTVPADWFPSRENERPKKMQEKKVVATYDYKSAKGELLYQVVRYHPKDFRCRKRTTAGGWEWNMEGVTKVPYRLPELLADKRQPVVIVEGEKDVDNLRSLGLVGTCNPGGAGKWPHSFGSWLVGRRVAIIPDADEPGQDHAIRVAGSLLLWGVASLRVVTLDDDSKDVSDWINNSVPAMSLEKKRDALIRLLKAAPEWGVINRRAVVAA